MDIQLSATGPFSWDIVLTDVPGGGGNVARDVVTGNDLETAVLVSLFTDARDDSAPVGEQRGWWGDEDGALGSKLWTLLREKVTAEVVDRARVYAQDALAWLTEDGVATLVTVTSERTGLYSVLLSIAIQRPDLTSPTFRFALSWQGVA